MSCMFIINSDISVRQLLNIYVVLWWGWILYGSHIFNQFDKLVILIWVIWSHRCVCIEIMQVSSAWNMHVFALSFCFPWNNFPHKSMPRKFLPLHVKQLKAWMQVSVYFMYCWMDAGWFILPTVNGCELKEARHANWRKDKVFHRFVRYKKAKWWKETLFYLLFTILCCLKSGVKIK